MNKTLFLLFFLPILVKSIEFEFKKRRFVTDKDNWNQKPPCRTDIINFDSSDGYIVAFVNNVLEASQIYLPDNGLIVFNNPTALGDPSDWQCSNSENQEDIRFEADIGPSFHDPASWMESEKVFLHMNKIPSSHDTVIFSESSAVQVSLDSRVTVNRFNYYGRNMTTDDMTRVIRTMEGQFQFLLSGDWVHENDRGNIQRMLADDPIIINNDEKLKEPIEGFINKNAENHTLQLICRYVTCQPLDCVGSFQPTGHCCPVCGARATFHGSQINFRDTLQRATDLVKSMGYQETHIVSLEHIESVSLNSIYELLVVPKDQTESYREESYDSIITAIMKDINKNKGSNYQTSIFSSVITLSRTDRTILWSSKLIGISIYIMIIVVCIGAYLYKVQELRPKLPDSFAPIIYWNKSKEDVRVELEVEPEETSSEEILVSNTDEENLISKAPDVEKSEVEVEETSAIELVEVTKTDIENDEEEDIDAENCNPNFEMEEISEVEPESEEETENSEEEKEEGEVLGESEL